MTIGRKDDDRLAEKAAGWWRVLLALTVAFLASAGPGAVHLASADAIVRDADGSPWIAVFDGLEAQWSEAVSRRVASFPLLPLGSHRLPVVARSDGGPRSEPGTVVAEPRFVATWWFPLLLGAVAASLVAATAAVVIAVGRRRERRLEAEVASRTAELERLGELSQRVNTAVRLEEVLDHVFDSFRTAIPYDRIGFALIDSERGTVRAVWARGDTQRPSSLDIGYEAPLAGSSLEQVLESGEPRILGDLERYLDEHPRSESTRRIVEEGLRSSLTCPLTAMGRPVGFLFFTSRQRHAYTAEHVRFFQSIARQVSQSVERSRLYEDLLDTKRQLEKAYVELERMAAVDPLTGVANRRSFDASLELEWRRGARTGRPLAVLLLDVDHFKRYNDALGHGAGDDCLRRVAVALDASLRRAGEVLARYGGEEFVAVLPDTGVEDAREAGERLRAAIADLAIPHPDASGRRQVTISVGVAAAVPGVESSPRELMEAADRALYRAKVRGRDRVEVAD